MKGISKKQRGISLIVLVITIIVMIILASAIILSLQSSGIIEIENEAKNKSDEATLREAASIKLAEYELGVQMGDIASTTTASEYVKEELEKDGVDITGLAITPDGSIQTGLSEIAVKFVEAGIKVGDTVTGYDLSSNTTTSYTTDGKENTAPLGAETDPTVQTIARGTELAWKYIGIDENGDALIVADSTGTLSEMRLSGKGGYLNGPEVLDTACAALYSSDMGKARSIDYEDVIKLLDYIGPQGHYYDDEGNEVKIDEPLTLGEIYNWSDEFADLKWDDITISKTDTYIRAGETAKQIVYQQKIYWLASSCVGYDYEGGEVYFELRSCDSSHIWHQFMSGSTGGATGSTCSIRPVVKLASDVQMSYNGTTVTLSK